MPLLGTDVPLLAGALLAWSLAAPPGPGNALIAQDAARRGWLAGVSTGMGAITADLLMFLLMWLGVLRLLERAPWVQVALGAVGIVLMAKFALDAWRSARRPVGVVAGARGGFLKTFVSIVTSPFNHAWWLTTGTLVFSQLGPWMVVGFFGALVLWIFFWAGISRVGGVRVKRFETYVAYASAVVLAVFALVVAYGTASIALRLTSG